MKAPTWLQSAGKVAKRSGTRHLVFEDPSVLTQLERTVHAAAASAPPSTPSPTATTPIQDDEATRTSFSDPDFHSPYARSCPEAANALSQAFGVLRDSCAGCRRNQDALRQTSLVDTALKFAVEQAPFACAKFQPPTSVRLAVQAALQFACNYCVGNEGNQALVWKAWFPRGLMELTNGLKTDRRLLSVVVALIHNCCLPLRGSGGLEGTGGDAIAAEACAVWIEGQERLRNLTSDKAFCCLLMKVVPHRLPTESQTRPLPWNSKDAASSASASPSPDCSVDSTKRGDSSGGHGGGGEDPAAEWLYLLFCRFVQEGLSPRVYDNVGIPADCRSLATSDHRRSGSRDTAEEWVLQQVMEKEEEELFFPVTPEQLVVLNLAEVAANDEIVTGGERPSPEQRQACHHLVVWLSHLLVEMPLNQSLSPCSVRPLPPEVENKPEVSEAASEEAELARRRLREEARSSMLRALAVLLASCEDETRRTASAVSAISVSSELVTSDSSKLVMSAPDGNKTDRQGARVAQSVPSPRSEVRLVPLCLSLLSSCGGTAEPEAKVGGGYARKSTAAPGEEGDGGVGRVARAPAGRKVDLLKVIGNACFRCPEAQDLAREVGGLPLVLNHCAVDGTNPLLREYALLAVRNLCEGNPANQAAIAALEPQGCAPGAEEALAAVGLKGRVDADGKLRVDPRASSET